MYPQIFSATVCDAINFKVKYTSSISDFSLLFISQHKIAQKVNRSVCEIS